MMLTKPVTDNKRLAGLDHLRALAILLVFFCHYRAYARPGWVDAIGRFGWTGVDLFFVLSGYLIGGQLLKQVARGEQIHLGEFYLSRFLRIIPAYLVVVALYFAIPVFRERDGISPLWKFLTFTANFGLDFQYRGAFSHSWSLCIEEQFYLLLPLIIMGLVAVKAGSRSIYVVLVLFLLGFATRIYSWMQHVAPFYEAGITEGRFTTYNMWVYYPTYNRLDGLLTGISIAALFIYRPRLTERITRHGNWLLLAGLIMILSAYFLNQDHLSFNSTVFGLPFISLSYGVIVLAALSPTCILYRVPLRVSTFIATLAYSIYLTHKQLGHLMHLALDRFSFSSNSTLMFFICLGVSVLGGWLLHMIVEKPFLRLRNRWLKKKKQQQAVQPHSIRAQPISLN